MSRNGRNRNQRPFISQRKGGILVNELCRRGLRQKKKDQAAGRRKNRRGRSENCTKPKPWEKRRSPQSSRLKDHKAEAKKKGTPMRKEKEKNKVWNIADGKIESCGEGGVKDLLKKAPKKKAAHEAHFNHAPWLPGKAGEPPRVRQKK